MHILKNRPDTFLSDKHSSELLLLLSLLGTSTKIQILNTAAASTHNLNDENHVLRQRLNQSEFNLEHNGHGTKDAYNMAAFILLHYNWNFSPMPVLHMTTNQRHQ